MCSPDRLCFYCYVYILVEFIEWFEGEYDNWAQASSNPTSFAHIFLSHQRTGEFSFHCEQRYSHEKEPYRSKDIVIVPKGDVILVQNPVNDLIFQKMGKVYRGVNKPGVMVKGAELVSRVELGPNYYVVIDGGIDKNGKQVWGSENGPFIFDKKDK